MFLDLVLTGSLNCQNLLSQKLRLKSIEIGQFLDIKYKQKRENKAMKNIIVVKMFGMYLGIIVILRIQAIKHQNRKLITTPGSISWFSQIFFPSLLRNCFSSIQVVLLKKITNKGKATSVLQKIIVLNVPRCSISYSPDKNTPQLIPNQKIKFHFLSLLSHLGCTNVLVRGRCFASWMSDLFIMFISTHGLKSYTNIVAEYILSYKKIVQITMLYAFSLSTCAVFANGNGAEYSRQDIASIIAKEELNHLIPTGLLAAIAKTESSTRTLAVNMGGKSVVASSISEAKSIIQQKLAEGVTNIDIGVMQLNYRWHGKKFADLDEMLNPQKNIAYAAKMLKDLKDQHGSWQLAIRYYHSYTPVYNMAYSRKVTLCWLES